MFLAARFSPTFTRTLGLSLDAPILDLQSSRTILATHPCTKCISKCFHLLLPGAPQWQTTPIIIPHVPHVLPRLPRCVITKCLNRYMDLNTGEMSFFIDQAVRGLIGRQGAHLPGLHRSGRAILSTPRLMLSSTIAALPPRLSSLSQQGLSYRPSASPQTAHWHPTTPARRMKP